MKRCHDRELLPSKSLETNYSNSADCIKLITAVKMMLVLGGLVSCADPNTQLEDVEDGASQLDVNIPKGVLCVEGAARDCGVEQGVSNGRLTCGVGLQFCRDGEWSGCYLDASKGVKKLPVPKTTQVIPLQNVHINGNLAFAEKLLVSGGDAQRCDNNPCNPYCWFYSDSPATPYVANTITTNLPYNASVQSLTISNVNSAYKTAGSDSDACPAKFACQFDQRCMNSDGGTICSAFDISEQNSCTGVDITVPPTCNDSVNSPTFRAISVCNRGSAVATAGIQCYAFPPDTTVAMGTATPDLSKAIYLGATTSPLPTGECTTLWIDNTGGRSCSNNAQCGSGVCNGGTCTGTANFHTGATQLIVCNPRGGGSHVITVPTSSGNGPSASSSAAGIWTTTTGATNPSILAFAAAAVSDGNAVITIPSTESNSSITFSDFGFNLPAEATVNAIRTTVRWKMHSPPASANMSIQAYTAGGNEAIGDAASVNSTAIPSVYTTTVQTASGLQLSPSQLSDEQLVVKIQISR